MEAFINGRFEILKDAYRGGAYDFLRYLVQSRYITQADMNWWLGA
jgi:hypothetical protein